MKNQTTNQVKQFVWWLCLLAFLISISLFTYQVLDRSINYLRFAKTTGVVTHIVESDEDNFAVIRFQLKRPELSTFETQTIASNKMFYRFKVGDTVDVYYNPHFPDEAFLDLFFDQWISSTLLGVITLVLLVFCIRLKPQRLDTTQEVPVVKEKPKPSVENNPAEKPEIFKQYPNGLTQIFWQNKAVFLIGDDLYKQFQEEGLLNINELGLMMEFNKHSGSWAKITRRRRQQLMKILEDELKQPAYQIVDMLNDVKYEFTAFYAESVEHA